MWRSSPGFGSREPKTQAVVAAVRYRIKLRIALRYKEVNWLIDDTAKNGSYLHVQPNGVARRTAKLRDSAACGTYQHQHNARAQCRHTTANVSMLSLERTTSMSTSLKNTLRYSPAMAFVVLTMARAPRMPCLGTSAWTSPPCIWKQTALQNGTRTQNKVEVKL